MKFLKSVENRLLTKTKHYSLVNYPNDYIKYMKI